MRLPSSSATKRSAEQKADSIRTQGILSPLLVRPLTENGFEIVFGERRYRAAQLAEQETAPVRIKQMTDAEALEAQLVEIYWRVKLQWSALDGSSGDKP
jgi:ParB family transcriptional regulator, chromosome partitioning protein